MILNFGAVPVQWRPCSRMKTMVCLASPSVNTDHLRLELDNLHKEAHDTRAKSSNARLRLLRLSEAVENLRRQAAINAQTGKENDARELLFQKKKVMQAMEKMKRRIELFDELSAKLNEAISMKETLLLRNMALDLDVNEEEAPIPIRIVSSTENFFNTSDNEHNIDSNNLESGEDDQDLPVSSKIQDDISENGWKSQECFEDQRLTNADNVRVLREISTYNDFIMNIDQQLNKIEEELETFLRHSNLLLRYKEKLEYSKVHHVMEILTSVGHIRERISSIRQTK